MANLLDLSPDEFMFTLQEFGYSPKRRDELIRQYREHNSVFGALNRAAQERQVEIAGEGRRTVAGGFLSKPEGSLGMDAVRGLRVEPMAGLLGMLTGAGRAVEAPAAAYQGLIPIDDIPLEALGTAGMASLGGAAMTRPAGSVGMGGRVAGDFDVTRRDASSIFGEGTERVRYTDPSSGGTMEVVVRPDGRASVLELEVPEAFRGQGIGQSLQSRIMQDFPVMGGQVSSRAAATTAYRLGRRPYGQPDATLEDVFRAIDEDSSVNLISPQAQPATLSANRDQTVGLLSTAAAAQPRNAAERMARDILDMRAAGRAGEVTDEMMAQADPQYMFANTPLPMDEASRMVRAREMFPDIAFHATGRDFDQFIPSEFRGASFFATTPDGASRGAAASANEGVGSGSSMVLPVRVNTSKVEGLGAYGQRDMNDFRASLPNRVFREPEMDALMASDAAPRYSNWTHFFDDLTDYDALRQFREKNPDDPIPDGIIGYQPRQPLRYDSGLQSDISGRQFAHYSEGMSERPISEYAKSIGNTGFTMMDESGLALAVTDPSTIRSRFARFDPEFSHLANLNAANIDPLAGLFGALAAEEQRRQRNSQ